MASDRIDDPLDRVNSWRDDASDRVDQDFQALLDVVMPWAERSRSRYRHMIPFGATVTDDGQVAFAIAQGGPDDDTIALMHILQEAQRARRAELRAVVQVADVRSPVTGGDAIRMQFEHIEGTAIEVLAPYKRNLLLRRVRFGEMETFGHDGYVFANLSGSE